MACLRVFMNIAVYLCAGLISATALSLNQPTDQRKTQGSCTYPYMNLLVTFRFVAKLTITPSNVVVQPGQKNVLITCQLSGLSHQFHLVEMEVLSDPKSMKSKSAQVACTKNTKKCTIKFKRVHKEQAVWYSCVAHIRGAQANAKPFSLGKQFRVDMKPRGPLYNYILPSSGY